eukprot:jgi/Mesvir1/8437/Mv03608-RA.1
MESCPLFKGKQALTEEEAAVARAGYVPPGSSLVRWSSRAPPPQEGWVSCVLCDGLMPARKTELTLLTRGAYAFYHADCFASSLRSRDESRLPPPPEPEDGDEEGATPVSSVSPVSSSGDAPRARSRAALPPWRRLVVPAIFGVGAAIGTIQFGAGAFPNLFKGRDGKVDRNKVNLGGLAAGALVFLIARHVLS